MIGLLQVDGKWPNLALMHLGGWLREQGEDVRRISPLEQQQCERVYGAKVFQGSSSAYVREDAIRGGTGWADWRNLPDLPDEAEHSYPAYDLWNCTLYAMGHLTRGCVRRCPFCVVPEKEGKIRHHSYLSEWWRGQGRIRLLDPNITASPDVEHYLFELLNSEAAVDFNQGIDARLITPRIARLISKVRRYKRLHTAWDRMRDEEHVLRGIGYLLETMPKDSIITYVLIGFDTTPEEDLYRVTKLEGLGANPFVMPYNANDRYQRRFARWCNHKAIFKSVAWKDYDA